MRCTPRCAPCCFLCISLRSAALSKMRPRPPCAWIGTGGLRSSASIVLETPHPSPSTPKGARFRAMPQSKGVSALQFSIDRASPCPQFPLLSVPKLLSVCMANLACRTSSPPLTIHPKPDRPAHSSPRHPIFAHSPSSKRRSCTATERSKQLLHQS